MEASRIVTDRFEDSGQQFVICLGGPRNGEVRTRSSIVQDLYTVMDGMRPHSYRLSGVEIPGAMTSTGNELFVFLSVNEPIVNRTEFVLRELNYLASFAGPQIRR